MHIYERFADLFEYPTPELAGRAEACAEASDAARAVDPDAVELLDRFCAAVSEHSLVRLQEIYTSTFDLKPQCYPYIGYHLFGESYKRGAFMARLAQEYCSRQLAMGNELPDHVGVVLRFLALDGDTEFGRTLLHEGLIPAMEEMAGSFDGAGDNPYSALVRALLLTLQEKHMRGGTHA